MGKPIKLVTNLLEAAPRYSTALNNSQEYAIGKALLYPKTKALWVKAPATKANNLSSISGFTCKRRESTFVSWFLTATCFGMHVQTNMQINKYYFLNNCVMIQ